MRILKTTAEFSIKRKFFLFPRRLRLWPKHEKHGARWADITGLPDTSVLDALNVPEDGVATKAWLWLESAWVVRWRLGSGFNAYFLANEEQVLRTKTLPILPPGAAA